jgi:LuxR family maltose regulon positive regulatory protein
MADHYLRLILDGRTGTVRALLAAFPSDALSTYPELAVAFAKSRLHDGLLDESAAFIATAERLSANAPDEQRRGLELPLGEAKLALARRRGDLSTVLEQMRSLEAAVQAQPASQMVRNHDLRAAALLNLGIAELWSSRLDAARRDLEQALALARRIGRPYLEIGCLAHLGIAAPLRGEPLPVGLELAEEGISIAEAHGWGADPGAGAALAVSGIALVWLGRFAEAEERLDRAQHALRPDGEPGTELTVHHACGLLRLTEGRFEQALAAFREAQRMQTLLAREHPLTHELRNRILQTQVRMGDTAAARAACAGMSTAERATAGMLIAAATLHLAEGDPQAAVEALAPVTALRAPVVHPQYAATEASVIEAAAHRALGDQRAADISLERALGLAEREGIILPFALAPVRELLERHRGHRTAHATLLATILDVLSGSSPPSQAPALREPLSEAELRVVRYLPGNLKATEIAAELCVSANTVRTHLRHIYAKLDAHTRTEAVSRARQLGLLAPQSRLH